jgi:uncharacterized protein YndB with AHSA1/START domain
MKKGDPPVVVEQSFHAGIGSVWNAITDIDQMHQWYFENIPAFKPEVGFTTRFTVENEGRIFPHLWEVTEVVPLKKIEYNWKFEGYPGDSLVAFELREQDNQTILTVTARVVESFPGNVPEFTRESAVGGWEYFINQRLKEYLSPRR